ncbi:hypothetical protein A3F66_03460 [candidate division TM6 bacterium RIFCSPHIGHO2_12_FULL_32_22]|nr:MAG: hypothetical protein A3F66_03460 [candidate division TM6 bacterium RIFCSPHIGHO2_12_FULL_32_22]
MNYYRGWLLGLELEKLNAFHVTFRALVVLIVGFLIARLSRRLVQKDSIFDFLLKIIVGSMLAEGIVGSAPFLPTIGGAFLISIINLGFNVLMFKFPRLESIIKGKTVILIDNGTILEKNVKSYFVTNHELLKAVHSAGISDVDEVRKAYLDNTGEINIIKK